MYKCKLYRRSGLLCAVVLLVKEKEGQGEGPVAKERKKYSLPKAIGGRQPRSNLTKHICQWWR